MSLTTRDPAALVPLPEKGRPVDAARARVVRPGLWVRARAWVRRHPTAVTLIGSSIVLAALAFGLWGKRGDFAEALVSASWWILAGAVALQLVWLLARSEA